MEQILKQWDRAAETYRTTQASSPDARWNRELAARRFSDLTGQTVLDAGCGCGEYTEQFRCAGARVVGCDGSAEMLRLARERFPLCEFRQSDLLGPLPFSNGQFDLVFCNQVLMDLPEIRGLLGEFHRVVREGGILFFGIVHPMAYPGEWVEDAGVKTAKVLRSYAQPYRLEHRFCGGTTHFHRSVSWYLNLAVECGFRLTHLEEQCVPSERDVSGIPLFLFAEFQKQSPL